MRPVRRFHVPSWHKGFLFMLPSIQKHAAVSFRHLDPEAREEAIQEVVANALQAYVRLVKLDKINLAYPTVLARYAVAQVNEGRKVGGHLNIHDVSSQYAQRQKNFIVERLDHFDPIKRDWDEVLVADKTTGPADIAAMRIDFTEWLRILPGRLRRIANLLATGEKPGVVAQKLSLSASRISQLRKELAEAWQDFQSEILTTA